MAPAVAAGAAALLALDIAETVLVQIVGQMVSAVVGSVFAPDLLALQEDSFRIQLAAKLVTGFQGRSLDPGISIDAFIKGHRTAEQSQQDVAAQGYNQDAWEAMQQSAGDPPPLDFVSEAFRRGLIERAGLGKDATSWQQAVYESRLKNKWWPLVEKMQYRLPDPGTVVEARLRGYINDADFGRWMDQIGYDATVRGFIFKAAGVPISPSEGYTAFHRGLIPKDDPDPDVPSLAQIFRESRINDKYLGVWTDLQLYIPPPRTITALLRAGSITAEQAKTLLKWNGLDEPWLQAYIDDASRQKSQAVKELAVGTVVNMYKAKELSREQALGYITAHGYDATDAAFLLDYADFQLVEAQVAALVSRLRTYYVGHKIQKQQAVDSLTSVGMATETINALLAVWDQEAQASPTLLTATEIATAAAQRLMSPMDAFNELQGRGYDARDAYIHLAIHKVDVSGIPAPPGAIPPA